VSGWSVTLSCAPAERDLLIADLWEAGTTGITEEQDWVRAFFNSDTDRDAVLRRFALYCPSLETVEDRDWVEHSRSMWRAFPLGERFWLAPEWSDEPAPQGRLLLRMRAGMASGSGLHPATQLCLLAMEKRLQSGMSVLDIGTGSGILADAALLLGAGHVVGCDIDAEAAAIARRNVPCASIVAGSLRSLRQGRFDLAVGNLNAATIDALARDLRAAAPTLIVSGFREDEAQRVEQSLGRAVRETLELDGWACLIC
jgi:ribosomal protein L11 methyltransferase